MIPSHQTRLSSSEFIPLLAMMMALLALSLDTMLPALSTIAQELGAVNENDAQFVIGIMFAGLSCRSFNWAVILWTFVGHNRSQTCVLSWCCHLHPRLHHFLSSNQFSRHVGWTSLTRSRCLLGPSRLTSNCLLYTSPSPRD